MSGEEAEFLDSGVCRDMKTAAGDRDTRGGGNASLMGVIRMTGQHWGPGRMDQPAADSKLPDCREQSDLPDWKFAFFQNLWDNVTKGSIKQNYCRKNSTIFLKSLSKLRTR